MSHARVTTRPGAYADSVRLMQVSQLIGSADGVEAALVAMATDLNLDLARDMGFTVSDATADDLLIAVRATDATALDAAVELAEQRLAARPHPQEPGGADGVPARTVRSVARQCTSRWSARAIPTWRPQLRTSFTPSASIRSVGPSGPGGRRRRHGGRRRRGEPLRDLSSGGVTPRTMVPSRSSLQWSVRHWRPDRNLPSLYRSSARSSCSWVNRNTYMQSAARSASCAALSNVRLQMTATEASSPASRSVGGTFMPTINDIAHDPLCNATYLAGH